MKIGIIIQARTGSKRLPGKVLKKINGKTIIQILIEKAMQVKNIDEVIVATSNKPSDDIIEKYATINDAKCFRGSEDNVLRRYVESAKLYHLDIIIRLTADCPLLNAKLINESLEQYLKFANKPDYFYIEGYPNGLGAVEILSKKGLLKCGKLAKSNFDKEHVMTFMVKNPDLFDLKILKVDKKIFRPELRVCVDTIEDLKTVREICRYFNSTEIDPGDLIRFLDKNPQIKKINEHVKQTEFNMDISDYQKKS